MEGVEETVLCIDGTQAHHWIIVPSKGEASIGTCKKCNQTKNFYNSVGALTSWREAGQRFRRKHQLTNLGGKDKSNGS